MSSTTTTNSMTDRTVFGSEAAALIIDLDPEVRIAGIIELTAAPSEQVAAALVSALGTEREFAIRETLTWAVLQMPDLALPYLHRALTADHWLPRMQALHVLSKWGRREDASSVIGLVDDPHPLVAARAWWAAGQTGDPEVVPALIGVLGRGDNELQNTLSASLALLGAPAVEALARTVRSPGTPAARTHAADALAYIGTPRADRATLALIETVQDPAAPEQVRFAALNAVGLLPSALVLRLLQDIAAGDQPRLADLAGRLLIKREAERDDLTDLAQRTGRSRLEIRKALRDHGGDRYATLSALMPARNVELSEGTVVATGPVLVELLTESGLTATSKAFTELAESIVTAVSETGVSETGVSEAGVSETGAPESAAGELDRRSVDALPLRSGSASSEPASGRTPDGQATIAGTVGSAVAELAEAADEVVQLGRVLRLSVGSESVAVGLPVEVQLGSFLLGPGPTHRVAAVAAVTGGRAALAAELAQVTARQVAESAPSWSFVDEVPDSVITEIRDRATAATGTPLSDRRLNSAVGRELHQHVLFEQPSVSELGLRVSDHFKGTQVRIVGWLRLQLGQG